MFELDTQLKAMHIKLDAIVFATSSGRNQAGLALGAKVINFKEQVLGISIDQAKTAGDHSLQF